MKPTITQSIEEVIAQAEREIAERQALIANLKSFGGGKPVHQKAEGKRRRAPKGALNNAILDALKSGPMTNAQLREHIKASGYIYSLAPEIVRQACHKLKKEKPAKIKATGEGQGMKYALAK